MYGTHRVARTVLGLSTFLLAQSANAVFEPNGLYFIGGIGWSWVEDAKLKGVEVVDFTFTPVVDTKQEFMFRVGLGTLFTDVFGVEFRYNFFNSTSTRIGTVFDNTLRMTTSPEYFDLVGLLRFEASPQFSLFVTLGPGYGHIGRTYDNTASNVFTIVNGRDTKNSSGWGVAASIGIQYEFSPLWGLRLEAAGMDGRDNIKVGSISGNFVINIL